MTKENILMELENFALEQGMNDVVLRVLSDSANLLVLISPYDIVARIAVYGGRHESINNKMVREIEIAKYLHLKGLDVTSPSLRIAPGPHRLKDHLFTLWQFEEVDKKKKMTLDDAVSCLDKLSVVMGEYQGILPHLGVWKKVHCSADRLRSYKRSDIINLLDDFDEVDCFVKTMETSNLIACHGDAHIKNLIATESSWIWSDFEDVSLMPRYWDWASLIANIVLFNGLDHPIYHRVMEEKVCKLDQKDFLMTLKARVVMSIIGNLDDALHGLGDLEFAQLQLEKYEQLMDSIEGLSA